MGVELDSVRVTVLGDFAGEPAVSEPVTYEIELHGSGDLERLAREVDRIAEIPNSLRQGTPVSLGEIRALDDLGGHVVGTATRWTTLFPILW